MRAGTITAILCLLCIAALSEMSGAADDFDPDEFDNAATPLKLPDLLPEGGIEAVDVDFWMRIEATHDGRPMDIRFIRWLIQPIDGQLVFTMQRGRAGDRKLYNQAKTTYSKQGRLTEYQQLSYLRGKKTSETTGTVVDGQLVSKTTEFDDAGQVKNTKEESQSLEAFESTLPSEWFSLIAAYHIRRGSLGYHFARTDLAFNFQHAQTYIEDVGTEQVEHQGKHRTAHMLLGERTFGKAAKDKVDSKLQYLVLPNGELMYMRNQYYGYQFLGERVTAEAIKDEFWLPAAPAQAPQAP